MKYLDKVEMNNLLLTILWVIFSIPLYLALSNALGWTMFPANEVEEKAIEVPIIEEIPEIRGETITPEEVEVNKVELTDITIINDNGYIWEWTNPINHLRWNEQMSIDCNIEKQITVSYATDYRHVFQNRKPLGIEITNTNDWRVAPHHVGKKDWTKL